MAKIFLSSKEQLDHLEFKKGLRIDDRDNAETMLMQIGYFGLISGYKELFKDPTTKRYRDGTGFSDVVALYKFDEALRELFFKYLLQIERNLSSLVSYYFTEKYGESQSAYLTPDHFNNTPKNRSDIKRLISMLENLAVNNKNYPYIVHQRKSHGNVPLWIIMNAITFGSLSKFYKVLPQEIKVKVSKHFPSVNEKQLEQFLRVITKYRNICAHGERLFSFRNDHAIPDTPLHQKLQIPLQGTQFVCGKHDLFAVVIAFRYLLPDADFRRFKRTLKHIIKKYFAASKAISADTLFSQMGFPHNWNKITYYCKSSRKPHAKPSAASLSKTA